MLKSEYLQILFERGFIQDSTDLDQLDSAFKRTTVTAYIGYDATAKSLHVGNLLNIMMLRWMQKCGHKPLTLLGGGTTKVGDPSFRSEERPLLTSDEINSNIASIQTVFSKYLKYEEISNKAIMINNAEWLDHLNYLNFLRDIGKYFSINRMLSFESVKSRIDREQSLSFLEFNYMILQAYDYFELEKRYGCTLQMGGSDQWGNIVNGIDLIRRKSKKTVFGLTSPLITTSSGQKMGKSQNGAIWLNKNLTSPYEFWQFWRNTDDSDVGKFLKMFTELPLDECNRLEKLKGSEINEAKEILATEATILCHGLVEAEQAKQTALSVFSEGSIGVSLPTVYIKRSEITNNYNIVSLFLKAGLGTSGKDIKRLILERGAKIDGNLVTEPTQKIRELGIKKLVKLSAGKKRHVLIEILD